MNAAEKALVLALYGTVVVFGGVIVGFAYKIEDLQEKLRIQKIRTQTVVNQSNIIVEHITSVDDVKALQKDLKEEHEAAQIFTKNGL